MMRFIWRQKILIVAVASIFGLMAAGYSFYKTPEYEVSTVLRPSVLNDLDEINRSKIYNLPPKEALNRVGAALDSYDTRLGYFRSNSELQAAFSEAGRTPEQSFEDFNRNALKLIQSDPKQKSLSAFIGLEMRYPEGVNGKDALNGFVQYAIESERKRISEDLRVIISNRLKEVDAQLEAARVDYEANKAGTIAELLEGDNLKRAQLNDELRALRAQLKLRREDRIVQLTESIDIAHSLGLKKPSTPSAMGRSEVETGGSVIRTEVNNQQIPLYFMGTEALEAERRVLQKRKSDDFVDPKVSLIRKELLLLANNRRVQTLEQRKNEELFLKGIESLRAERARLMSIPTDMSRLRLVSIDRLAVEPVSPIAPKKSLIIFLGVLLGVLVGCVLALLRYATQVHQVEKSQIVISPLTEALEEEPSRPLVMR